MIKYILVLFPFPAAWIRLEGGAQCIRYKRYVYTSHCKLKYGDRWRCNQYINNGCLAHLVLDYSLNILRSNDFHIHAPPMYVRKRNGEYVKVPDKLQTYLDSLNPRNQKNRRKMLKKIKM